MAIKSSQVSGTRVFILTTFISPGFSDEGFHSDGIHCESDPLDLPVITSVFCLEAPDSGGETFLIDSRGAFNRYDRIFTPWSRSGEKIVFPPDRQLVRKIVGDHEHEHHEPASSKNDPHDVLFRLTKMLKKIPRLSDSDKALARSLKVQYQNNRFTHWGAKANKTAPQHSSHDAYAASLVGSRIHLENGIRRVGRICTTTGTNLFEAAEEDR